MTYSVMRTATETACRHQAEAARMARNTARSSAFDLNRSTLYDACCSPRASDTSIRKRSRSLRRSERQCACTRAMISISSGDGSGNSGTGSTSGTPQLVSPVLNKAATKHRERRFSTEIVGNRRLTGARA